jgi:hypothetical protein
VVGLGLKRDTLDLFGTLLLLEDLGVKFQFLPLKNVAITTTRLAWARRNAS